MFFYSDRLALVNDQSVMSGHFSRAIFFNLSLIFASSIASGENGSVQLNSPSVEYGLPAGGACVVTQI